MDFVGSGCEKAKHHLNPSPKRPKTLRNRKQKTGETLPTEPSKDKDKNVALVGSGCEKAKHHLNPSPKRPKTLRNRKQKTGETLPTEPSKDKDKNGSRRQCTTNLQAAGKTCPKTSWAFKKPANSTKLLGALPLSEGSADSPIFSRQVAARSPMISELTQLLIALGEAHQTLFQGPPNNGSKKNMDLFPYFSYFSCFSCFSSISKSHWQASSSRAFRG